MAFSLPKRLSLLSLVTGVIITLCGSLLVVRVEYEGFSVRNSRNGRFWRVSSNFSSPSTRGFHPTTNHGGLSPSESEFLGAISACTIITLSRVNLCWFKLPFKYWLISPSLYHSTSSQQDFNLLAFLQSLLFFWSSLIGWIFFPLSTFFAFFKMSNFSNLVRKPKAGAVVGIPNPMFRQNIRWYHTVVGKFHDEETFSADLVQQCIKEIWATKGKIEVMRVHAPLGRNAPYLLYCEDIRDKFGLVALGSVSIYGSFFMMIDPGAQQDQRAWDFRFPKVWIQMKGVPKNRITTELGCSFGSLAGRTLDVQLHACEDTHKMYLRVQVKVDIENPLCPGAFTETENDPKFIFFAYENIFHLCLGCGLVGHEEASCTKTSEAQLNAARRMILGHQQQGWNIRYQPKYSFYSRHNIAFPSVPEFMLTHVDLIGPKAPRYPYRCFGYGIHPPSNNCMETSVDSDGGDDDSPTNNDGEDTGGNGTGTSLGGQNQRYQINDPRAFNRHFHNSQTSRGPPGFNPSSNSGNTNPRNISFSGLSLGSVWAARKYTTGKGSQVDLSLKLGQSEFGSANVFKPVPSKPVVEINENEMGFISVGHTEHINKRQKVVSGLGPGIELQNSTPQIPGGFGVWKSIVPKTLTKNSSIPVNHSIQGTPAHEERAEQSLVTQRRKRKINFGQDEIIQVNPDSENSTSNQRVDGDSSKKAEEEATSEVQKGQDLRKTMLIKGKEQPSTIPLRVLLLMNKENM